jgi:hypothetical protein
MAWSRPVDAPLEIYELLIFRQPLAAIMQPQRVVTDADPRTKRGNAPMQNSVAEDRLDGIPYEEVDEERLSPPSAAMLVTLVSASLWIVIITFVRWLIS